MRIRESTRFSTLTMNTNIGRNPDLHAVTLEVAGCNSLPRWQQMRATGRAGANDTIHAVHPPKLNGEHRRRACTDSETRITQPQEENSM